MSCAGAAVFLTTDRHGYPVRNFEQYRDRFGKSAHDSRVQEE
jgi:hypothetical protein